MQKKRKDAQTCTNFENFCQKKTQDAGFSPFGLQFEKEDDK